MEDQSGFMWDEAPSSVPSGAGTVAEADEVQQCVSTLSKRYGDGYRVSNALCSAGSAVKALAVVVAVLAVLGAFMAMAQGGSTIGDTASLGALFIGLMGAASVYFFGVLISAAGQILRAVLDTAVNTSPYFDDDERLQVMDVG